MAQRRGAVRPDSSSEPAPHVENQAVPTFIEGFENGPESDDFKAIARGIRLTGELQRTAYEQTPFDPYADHIPFSGIVLVRFPPTQLATLKRLSR